jgi:hypothetical protein
MNNARELVAIAHDITGQPSYNGYTTAYEALWNIESEFRSLEFAERMQISLEVLADLENPFQSHEFFYTFITYNDEIICTLFDENDLTTPTFEWFWRDFKQGGIMKDTYDVKSLHTHLVKIGELLPEDTITLIL